MTSRTRRREPTGGRSNSSRRWASWWTRRSSWRGETQPDRANVTTLGRNAACGRSDTAANPDVGPKFLGGSSVPTLTVGEDGPWPAVTAAHGRKTWIRFSRTHPAGALPRRPSLVPGLDRLEPASHHLTLPSRASSGSPICLANPPREPSHRQPGPERAPGALARALWRPSHSVDGAGEPRNRRFPPGAGSSACGSSTTYSPGSSGTRWRDGPRGATGSPELAGEVD